MKLLIVGGGGFRVPQIIEVLAAARREEGAYPGLKVDQVCLYDVDEARLSAMAQILSCLNYGQAPIITVTTDLEQAVAGSAFIFSALRQGGTCGRVIDEMVALKAGVLGQETVGVGGYAYALRTIPVALRLAKTVRNLAPDAWVINFTNPAGIITQAMRRILGKHVVGICDTPIGLVRRAANAIGVDPLTVSSVDVNNDIDFDYVGLNHLGWLRTLKIGGKDRLPDLLKNDAALDHLEEARTIGADWIRALGMLPNEYLFYYYLNRESVARISGAETRGQFLDRQQTDFYAAVAHNPQQAGTLWLDAHAEREATYMAESREPSAHASRREEDMAGGGYQQVALDLMTAIRLGRPVRMILDVGNDDAFNSGVGARLIEQLRADAVVEVPCLVDGQGVHPEHVAPLRGAEAGLVVSVKGCEELIIEAALSGDKTLAWRAFAAHPLVDSIRVARLILDEYLKKNPEIAMVFN